MTKILDKAIKILDKDTTRQNPKRLDKNLTYSTNVAAKTNYIKPQSIVQSPPKDKTDPRIFDKPQRF